MKLKDVFNKKDRFHVAVMAGFAIVAFLAVFDILCMKSGVFGSVLEYLVGDYTEGWWGLFKFLALSLFVGLGLLYFFLHRRDKSEAVAVAILPYILWRFGVSDILFFWFQAKPVPTANWLGGMPFSWFQSLLGVAVVTPMVLYLTALSGIVIALGMAYVLKKYL